MKRIHDFHIKNTRKKHRIYDIDPIGNGSIFLVTVNSNKPVDLNTLDYRDGDALVDFDSTIQGINMVERKLQQTLTSSFGRPKIKDFTVEIGKTNHRLHTHFSVYIPHTSLNDFELDRDVIVKIFKKAWGLEENIYVNIKRAVYDPKTEIRFSDYMNQYVGPFIGDQGLRLSGKRKK